MKKEVKKEKKETKKDDNQAIKSIQNLTSIVVILGILIISLNIVVAFNTVNKSKFRTIIKQIETAVEEKPIEKEEEEEEIVESEYEIDYNKEELVKGIRRLFPQKNDSKVTGDNLYKKFNLKTVERHSGRFTFYYNNFKFVYRYIDGGGDSSRLTIYDKKTNKELKVIENIKTVVVDKNFGETNALPTISGGKLHYLIYNPKNCYVGRYETMNPYLEYRQIDLSNNKLSSKLILAVKGHEFGETPECE